MAVASLVGLVVVDIMPLDDGSLYLAFEKGFKLTIFNRFEIDGGDTSTLGRIKGERLASTTDSPTTVDFTFGNGMSIRVGMTESDFLGPEALEYTDESGGITVWRDEAVKRPTQ
jgi:hypothetical protein